MNFLRAVAVVALFSVTATLWFFTATQRDPFTHAASLGNFAPHVDYAARSINYDTFLGPHVADMNGDGYEDVVAYDYNLAGPYLSVLINNHDGTLTPHAYDLPEGIAIVRLGDLNGDARPDVVALSDYGSTMGISLNNGSGAFGTSTVITTPRDNPSNLELADVDKDGDLDILITDCSFPGPSCQLSVYANNAGSFGNPPTSYPLNNSAYGGMYIADFNGDTYPDVGVLNLFVDKLAILLNQGNGTFGARQEYATDAFPENGGMADVDHDGDLDLLVYHVNTPSVAVYRNDGVGGFTSSTFSVSNAYNGGQFADMNGDGYADIVGVNNAGSVAVILNNGDGTFNAEHRYASVQGATKSLVVADFNNDSRPDVVTNPGNGFNQIEYFENTGTGALGASTAYITGNNPYGTMRAVDLDHDGLRDLIVANVSDNTVSVLRNTTVLQLAETPRAARGVLLSSGGDSTTPTSAETDTSEEQQATSSVSTSSTSTVPTTTTSSVVSTTHEVLATLPERVDELRAPAITFTRNLGLGVRTEEVAYLQRFLNANGARVAPFGPGSPGQETNYFGPLTYRALMFFQEHFAPSILAPQQLRMGTGYFGTFTRTLINGLLGTSTLP